MASCKEIWTKICQNEAPAIPYLCTRVLPGKSRRKHDNFGTNRKQTENLTSQFCFVVVLVVVLAVVVVGFRAFLLGSLSGGFAATRLMT